MKLQVERIADADDLYPLLAAWEALDAEAEPRTPFSSPLWNTLWWKHYKKSHVLAGDEFFVHIVRDETDRLVAVAPLLRRRMPAVGPACMRIIQFFGSDPSITEMRGVVCRPEDRGAVLLAFQQYFKSAYRDWDLLLWDGIRDAPAEWGACGPVTETQVLSDYMLPLPATWPDLLGRVSSNTRKSVRKAYEFLKDNDHSFTFRAIEHVDALTAALHAFFALHASRALSTQMKVKHPDRFAGGPNREFMLDVVGAMGARGEVRFFELEVGGRLVASRMGFSLGKSLYVYYSGFDPEWRKQAVMTTLMSEILRWAIENRYEIVNLSTGTNLSKLRWRPIEVQLTQTTQRASGTRARLAADVRSAVVRSRGMVTWLKGYRPGAAPAPAKVEPE